LLVLKNKKKNQPYCRISQNVVIKCDFLILQPRFFKYKKKQKNRKCFIFNKNYFFKNNFFQFGSSGLLLKQPAQLTSKQIFRFKLFLKKASRKSDKTSRFV
jgi:ribosomal protein L16/L10AE